jgi:hypothetical protein
MCVWAITDCSQEALLNGLSLDTNDRIIHCSFQQANKQPGAPEEAKSGGCRRKGSQSTMYVLCKCFTDLIPLQMLILNTGLVVSQPFDCNSLFSFVETFGGDWTVWKEYHHHYTPHTTESSDDEKFKFPGRQACFDVPDSGRCQLISISDGLDRIYP